MSDILPLDALKQYRVSNLNVFIIGWRKEGEGKTAPKRGFSELASGHTINDILFFSRVNYFLTTSELCVHIFLYRSSSEATAKGVKWVTVANMTNTTRGSYNTRRYFKMHCVGNLKCSTGLSEPWRAGQPK